MINIVWFHLDEVLKVIKIIEAKGIIMDYIIYYILPETEQKKKLLFNGHIIRWKAT